MNIALDIESTGLRIDSPINYVGLYTEVDDQELFWSYTIPEQLNELDAHLAQLQKQNVTFILQNGKFDSVRLKYNLDIDIPVHHDTMVLGYLLSTIDQLKDNEKRKWLSLEALVWRYLGIPDWKVSLQVKTSKSEETVAYLKKDCKYTYKVFNKMWSLFPKEKIPLYRFLLTLLEDYKKIELNGIPIDKKGVNKLKENLTVEMEGLNSQLKEIADINYNSSSQLSHLLFTTLGLSVLEKTEKGTPSTKFEVLTKLEGKHPIIDLLLKHRRLTKTLAFLNGWDEQYVHHGEDAYLHPSFNLTGTVTGRTSCSEPNLQQIPRDSSIKAMFRSVEEGWQLVQFDYSQIELRFAAEIANVKEMKQAYLDGRDLHTEMAMLITGKTKEEITKEDRSGAKAANFGYLYGMYPKSFVEYAWTTYGVVFDFIKAGLIRERYFQQRPELLVFYHEVERILMQGDTLYNIFGRPYKINAEKLINPYTRNDYLRPAINFPVQSSASDYVLCGLHDVINHPALQSRIRVGLTIHDSIITLVREDEKFFDTIFSIQTILERPPTALKLLKTPLSIPIKVDIEIGPLGLGVSPEKYLQQKGHIIL